MSNEPNMISLAHFPTKRGVMLNKKLYDAAQLSRLLKQSRSSQQRVVPHSRRPLTNAEIHEIMTKSGRVKRTGGSSSSNPYDAYMSRRRKRHDTKQLVAFKAADQKIKEMSKRIYDLLTRGYKQWLIRVESLSNGSTPLDFTIKSIDRSHKYIMQMAPEALYGVLSFAVESKLNNDDIFFIDDEEVQKLLADAKSTRENWE